MTSKPNVKKLYETWTDKRAAVVEQNGEVIAVFTEGVDAAVKFANENMLADLIVHDLPLNPTQPHRTERNTFSAEEALAQNERDFPNVIDSSTQKANEVQADLILLRIEEFTNAAIDAAGTDKKRARKALRRTRADLRSVLIDLIEDVHD